MPKIVIIKQFIGYHSHHTRDDVTRYKYLVRVDDVDKVICHEEQEAVEYINETLAGKKLKAIKKQLKDLNRQYDKIENQLYRPLVKVKQITGKHGEVTGAETQNREIRVRV